MNNVKKYTYNIRQIRIHTTTRIQSKFRQKRSPLDKIRQAIKKLYSDTFYPPMFRRPQRSYVINEDLSGTASLSPLCPHYSIILCVKQLLRHILARLRRSAVFHSPLDTRRRYDLLRCLESTSR